MPVDNALSSRRRHNAARFRQAAEDGESVRLRYHGGSQPGAQRSIRPVRVEGDDAKTRVMGVDETGLPKNYTMDRLDTLSDDEPDESPMYVGSERDKQRGRSYQQNRGYRQGQADPMAAFNQLARESGYNGNSLREAMGVVWNKMPSDQVGELIDMISRANGVPPPWQGTAQPRGGAPYEPY